MIVLKKSKKSIYYTKVLNYFDCMRIGIDCRMNDTSVLPYSDFIRDILASLTQNPWDDEYVLFFHETDIHHISLPEDWFQKVSVRSWVGSLSSQVFFALDLYGAKLDCVYFPHSHIPLLYFRPSIITVSDLKELFYPDRTTARGFSRYMYRFFLSRAMRLSKRIVTWSQYTLRDIIETFNIPEDRITVIAPSIPKNEEWKDISTEERKRYLAKQGIDKPYLLFVGEIREYKNLPRCIRAYSELVAEWMDIDFVIVGRELSTYHEVRNTIIELSLQSRVHVLWHITPEDLPFFYQGAQAYILPSIYEGSGFPLLPAITYNLPIICSNIPSLVETVGEDGAIFFRPLSVENMRESLQKALSDALWDTHPKIHKTWKTEKWVWDSIEKIIQTCQKTPKGKRE